VLGILAFILIPVIGSVLAIVFGVMGRNRAKEGAANGGMALAGLILGIVSAAFWALFILIALIGAATCSASPGNC
jgi:hypothetical protein